MTLKPIFDQSIFVQAALNSVIMGGLMAAGLTALMILLFLGNWRLTIIILASIPLSIITAVLVLYVFGQTLNTMTLGGFALAVGILVDNGTVVIENIERHVGLGEPLEHAILDGAGEVALPTMLATLSISLVFVPVFLLTGTAKYLFSPLSLSVIISLVASLMLSFTLVPLLFKYLMRSQVHAHGGHAGAQTRIPQAPRRGFNPFSFIHRSFERGFHELARGASQYFGLDGGPACPHRGVLRDPDRRFAHALSAARHGFLPANRRRTDAPARPRTCQAPGSSRRRTISRKSSAPSATSSATTRST